MSFDRRQPIKSTRKPHECRWCWQIIPSGSKTVYVAGTYDCDFYHDHYHPECMKASDRWWSDVADSDDEYPDWAMNRGGVREQNDIETEPLDTP